MLKKLFAGLAAALLCSTASASLVKYTLSDVRLNDGTTLEGFFVQDTDDNAIVHYWVGVGEGAGPDVWFMPSGEFDYLTKAQLNFYHGGPTSFRVEQDFNDATINRLHLGFRYGENGGVAAYGSLRSDPGRYADDWWDIKPRYRSIVSGTAIAGELEPELIEFLEDWGGQDMVHVVPTRMPEPASLALLAIGAAFGATRLRRRGRVA